MGKQVFTNAALFLDGLDVSGDHNAVQLDRSADAVDVTTINMADRARLPGLRSFAASMAGLWEAGTNKINDQHLNAIGAAGGTILSLAPAGAAEGSPVMFGQLISASYAPGASVGDALGFQVGMQGSGDLFLGTILQNAMRSGNGTGTIFNLGTVNLPQQVHVAVHLLSITGGGALTVTVRSSAVVGFTSPQTWFTSNAMAAIGAQLFTGAGPNNNAYWRAEWTLTGTAPTALFLVSFSIQ